MTDKTLLEDSRRKLGAALEILMASVDDYPGFNPEQAYSPKEREPFDALCDRYLRAFESSLRFFRTWERVYEATPSETFRDLLLRMAKLRLISGVDVWLNMRDVRNRIAHEYQPHELSKIYQAIVGPAAEEMRFMLAAIDQKLENSIL